MHIIVDFIISLTMSRVKTIRMQIEDYLKEIMLI
jgi:hypothetical protein